MSKLDELIAELCPDGVEYKPIGKLVNYEQPGKYIVKNTEYRDEFATPVLTAGQTFILGYTNETEGIYNASKDDPVIIFDDFTGAFKWVDFPFKVKSSAMKILKPTNLTDSLRYVFHIMGWLNYSSSEHKRLWISIYSEFKVPVPPLEVQREIIRVLDNFTELTAELTAELKAELVARKRQHEYYRNDLLSYYGRDAEKMYLLDVADVFRGKFITQKTSKSGNIPVIMGGQEPAYYIDESNHEGEIVVVARSGVSAGFVSYWNQPIFVTDGFGFEAKKEFATPKYLYYVLKNKENELNGMKRGSGVPHVSRERLSKVEIPIPDISIQKRIVDILDNFVLIYNNLIIDLPAEIEARQKQYEYYRDKLLTFKEKTEEGDALCHIST